MRVQLLNYSYRRKINECSEFSICYKTENKDKYLIIIKRAFL